MIATFLKRCLPWARVRAGVARSLLGLAAVLLSPLPAVAQSPCSVLNAYPVLQPELATVSIAGNSQIDCFMWQTFVYLTWPSKVGQRGQPDPAAPYGSSGSSAPAVWATYKSYDEVFLANAVPPGPWNSSVVALKALSARGFASAQTNGTPRLRLLSNKSKLFRSLKPELASSAKANTEGSSALNEIDQVGGGVLYDQAQEPVYYEMLLDQTEFNYIVGNQLYNANTQYQFAQTKGLALPQGSIELKAAWKVMSAQELSAKPLRFYTALALLPGSQTPVTVGLAGLHVFQIPSKNSFFEGFWATFAQVDNAPQYGQTPARAYSFNNPACSTAQCPPNTKSAAGTSQATQLVQMFPVAQEAQPLNTYMQQLIAQTAPQSPWQFYQLLNVQWPTSAVPIGTPGATAPLNPNTTMSTTTLMNPALESFLQTSGTSCFGCHTYGTVASPNNVSNPQGLASSFSFLLGHAKSPAAAKSR